MDLDFNDYFGSEVPLHELITNGQDYDLGYANLSTAKNIALYSLNGNDVDFDQASGNDQRMFISLTHALSKDLNSFDITKPCALCGDKGHTFDDCKELQDGFLKPAYIKLRLLTNRLWRSLDDLDSRKKDLNSLKHVELNSILSHSEAAPPTIHSVNSVCSSSGSGVVQGISSGDRNKINSVFQQFDKRISDIKTNTSETHALITNLSSLVANQQASIPNDDDSSTLGGRSTSTTNSLNLMKDHSDFQSGKYI